MDLDPIRFHDVHSEAIRVSGDGTEAQKIKYGVALSFTNRPLSLGEKLLLNIHRSVLTSLLGVGFTEHDPRTLTLPIRQSLSQGFDQESGIWGPAVRDEGWIVGSIESVIYIDEDTSRVMIEKCGSEPKELISGFRIRRPVYVVFAQCHGTPFVRITSKPQQEPQNLETAPHREKSETFHDVGPGPADFLSFGPTGVKSLSKYAVSNETPPRRGNLAFVCTPLKPPCTLIVKLTAVKENTPVKLVLTSEGAHRVCSFGSLQDLCDSTYSLMMESEISVPGDELALRISSSGAVFISRNNRGWHKRMHLDTDLEYHAVFDMDNICLLSMIGITTDAGGIEEQSLPAPSNSRPEPPPTVFPECIICFENARNVVLKPCSHVALCESCAKTLWRSDGPVCPMCRARIVDVQLLYLS